MKRQSINPWTWNQPMGYSQGVQVDGSHRTVYLAGQTAIDPSGNVTHVGDLPGQVGQALDNMEVVLAAADLTLADVVRLDIYTTDVDAYFAASHVLNERFGHWGNLPAGGILTEVPRLAMPPLMVELVATAAR